MAPPPRAMAVQAHKTMANYSYNHSWDDWVPQERLRKFTDENKELASNLKKDMDAQRRAASGRPASTSTTKKRPYGSDLAGSSARGSEDRSSAVPQPPRGGTKRGREIEGIDKVSFAMFACVSPSELAINGVCPALFWSPQCLIDVVVSFIRQPQAACLAHESTQTPSRATSSEDANHGL